MAIQLSKGEKIIRDYDYATVTSGLIKKTTTNKHLIVTNKRIINRSTSHGIGSENVTNYEMPVESAKYVNVTYGKKSHVLALFLGIVFCVLCLFLLFNGISNESGVFAIIGIILGIIGGVCIAVYVLHKLYSVNLTISTEERITTVLTTFGTSNGLLTKLFGASGGKRWFVRTKVDKEVAQNMAEELGCIIKSAANGEFDDIAE